MPFVDVIFIIKWWAMFFAIGLIFFPLTAKIFSNFFDKGYIFSKIIGIAVISYVIFVLGILKILPFTETTIFIVSSIFLAINTFFFVKVPPSQRWNLLKDSWKIFVFEEIIFFSTLLFWSFIHAHAPDIHGLEKYEDFGFINSIMRSEYFPPRDMWFTPLSINYYYFGHVVTAVLTKLSNMPSFITFNLMLATIFAFTFTAGFSIGANLICFLVILRERSDRRISEILRYAQNDKIRILVGGFLTAFIVSFAGNLHAIYTFFKPYANENPVPFWQLLFSPNTFPNSYWYPNATRFIHNTIHEFPLYSFVVSDLHAHVLDMPFVLLTIAILLSFFLNLKSARPPASSLAGEIGRENLKLKILLISFLLAVTYMTNAWDGIIYFLLTAIVFVYMQLKLTVGPGHQQNIKYYVSSIKNRSYLIPSAFTLMLILIGAILFSLPFNLFFKPFASGIGVLCAPEFLIRIGKIGPFLFEADHCQHSPLWQLIILHGFFYFWVISFIIFIFSKLKSKLHPTPYTLNPADMFVLILITISTLLIIIPEFIYIKDIYPAHYRANTMFKLIYQAFIMLSLSSGYIIIRLFLSWKLKIRNWKFIYWVIGSIGLLVVFLYPYLAINSYFGNLKTYYGLDGTKYLKSLYPTDYETILWINKNIRGQPVILEAQGDSYTDYARVSANTGLPTVLGWTVHEWLWRGTYDIPSPRIPEVQNLYETKDLAVTKQVINKYHISLIFLGDLEHQKYPKLDEEKFKLLGKIIYQNGSTKIYQLNNKGSD